MTWPEAGSHIGLSKAAVVATESISQALSVAASAQEECSMKVRASVKPRCERCKVIRRKGAVMVICTNPKHKQKQG